MARAGCGRPWRREFRSCSPVDIEGKVLIFATNLADGSQASAVVLAARAALYRKLELGSLP